MNNDINNSCISNHNSYCIQKITTEDEGLLPNYEILDFIKEDQIE